MLQAAPNHLQGVIVISMRRSELGECDVALFRIWIDLRRPGIGTVRLLGPALPVISLGQRAQQFRGSFMRRGECLNQSGSAVIISVLRKEGADTRYQRRILVF